MGLTDVSEVVPAGKVNCCVNWHDGFTLVKVTPEGRVRRLVCGARGWSGDRDLEQRE